jgi:hypothetical protein
MAVCASTAVGRVEAGRAPALAKPPPAPQVRDPGAVRAALDQLVAARAADEHTGITEQNAYVRRVLAAVVDPEHLAHPSRLHDRHSVHVPGADAETGALDGIQRVVIHTAPPGAATTPTSLSQACEALVRLLEREDLPDTLLIARVEGVCSVRVLETLALHLRRLRALDLSEAPGLTLRALRCIQSFPQLHELDLNLRDLRTCPLHALAPRLAVDFTSTLATLRLWNAQTLRVDLGHHVGFFQIPLLRELHFHGVKALTVDADWTPAARQAPWYRRYEAPTATGYGGTLGVKLVHRRRAPVAPVQPGNPKQRIIPV